MLRVSWKKVPPEGCRRNGATYHIAIFGDAKSQSDTWKGATFTFPHLWNLKGLHNSTYVNVAPILTTHRLISLAYDTIRA
jgi:hypothetical protein